jgi:hypothetical protein
MFLHLTHLAGIYYEPGKDPAPGAPPKLHLLIESNEEFRVSGVFISVIQVYRHVRITGGAGCEGD